MNASAYEEYVRAKLNLATTSAPLARQLPLNGKLYQFQAGVVDWALGLGRASVFLDCGLGKGPIALEWSRQVAEATRDRALVLAPLAVAQQFVREGRKFGVDVCYARTPEEATGSIVVTNYDRATAFDPRHFSAVALDESSILKAYMGQTKRWLLEAFVRTPFRLCCTATPAPNDHLELGNHAEFMGVLSSHEMIARWFINDTSTFGTYRLKRHAVRPFWQWVTSWARCAGKPSDLGDFCDDDYVLPGLRVELHHVDVDVIEGRGDRLFRETTLSATAVHAERRRTAPARAACIAELVAAEPHEQWLIWCETDYEADALTAAITGAVEVRGKMDLAEKEARLLGFIDGAVRVLVTKPKCAGFGLNLQQCARVAFAGPTWSYESYYQAIRRCWRFGQQREVIVHIPMAPTERDIWDVLMRKAGEHEAMKLHMFDAARAALAKASPRAIYNPNHVVELPEWITAA